LNIDALRFRSIAIRDIRAFFDEREFVEVDTPVRLKAPAPETHIDCPPVLTGGFLRASPELQMKKLLAAGMDRIYQIGPCFRDGEFGSRHRSEFTMLEWYRKGVDYNVIKEDLKALLAGLFSARSKEFSSRTVTVRQMYVDVAGWDPWVEWNQERFDYDMALKIEPAIKSEGGGIFLFDYPPQAASLSRIRDDSQGPVAERWEFYFDGVEIANCFSELCDSKEQTDRFTAAKAERALLGEADYPIDEEFLSKVNEIGSASGVALGIDRLLMALMGVKDIAHVRVDD
jgi:lysyl-tRNA synthetase class 2